MWDTIWRTAKVVNSGNVTRYVYAGAAVRDALPGPAIRIQAPLDDQAFPSGATIPAKLFVLDDGLGAPTVNWFVGAALIGVGVNPWFRPPDGAGTVIVVARYPNGLTQSVRVRVRVGSGPPPVR